MTFLEIFAIVGQVVGILYLARLGYRFLSFIWLYFLRPSSVHRYLHGARPYVLITGATDGVGKALASELYRRGFNLILHGRNEDKMRKVVEEIRGPTGVRDVRYFITDASKSGHDFEAIVEPFKDLNITVVVHNVGGNMMMKEKIDELPESHTMGVINMNSLFSVLLMRALLPTLRTSATHGPVIAHFIGSFSGLHATARTATYGGSKAFLQAFGRALDLDERAFGPPSGVRFAYLPLGEVVTKMVRAENTAYSPSSERFAKAYVDLIGYNARFYVPWWTHAFFLFVLDVLGADLLEWPMSSRVAELIEAHKMLDK